MISDAQRWFVVQSQPNAELKAVAHLNRQALTPTCRAISSAGGMRDALKSSRRPCSRVISLSRLI